jgi:hypothetical protein
LPCKAAFWIPAFGEYDGGLVVGRDGIDNPAGTTFERAYVNAREHNLVVEALIPAAEPALP